LICQELKKVIQIKTPADTPNSAGGYTRSYNTIKTIWGKLESIDSVYIRGEQINDGATHLLTIRKNAVNSIGKAFSKAFAISFDVIADINPLKSDYFIFVNDGASYKGRLFKILSMKNDEADNNYIKYKLKEVEEQGTGWNA
jgi:hypothetical protein